MRRADVFSFVAERCLQPGPGGLVGIEVEWFPIAAAACDARVPLAVLRSALDGLAPLPGHAAITFEPGGQLELSTLPQRGAAAACAELRSDLTVLRRRLEEHGIGLFAAGLHPRWAPERVLCAPRYEAMEGYFDTAAGADGRPEPSWGPVGRTMMTSTAAIQISVDIGPDPERTWRLAHDLGPVLVGAFANSPFARGRPTGFYSTRFANWWQLDPARTHPIGARGGAVSATVAYALAAPVLGIFVDGPGSEFRPLPDRRTFLDWMRAGPGIRAPDLTDLAYHLTTLFPPVRPRGWLELRMIDALPDPLWEVPVAVTAALLAQPENADGCLRSAAGLWLEAARHGLRHPVLAATARRAFAEAAAVLDDRPGERELAAAVREYAERYVDRGRCPADDQLDRWQRTGHVADVAPRVAV
ncbi:MAG TPA: glutamate-cysteine ligase family protein [Sporichthya sp.]|nr:glutamate-cysteine ligase family protein [Sporichthya sp.]